MSTGMGKLGLAAVDAATAMHYAMSWRNYHHTLKGGC